ncbi:MAG: hypothetical protein JNG84_14715, partial [Archangium sp.]|nr:hypothetical protein [Archangium sp.]
TGGDVTVVSDLLASYMQWKKFDLTTPVTTQKLTVVTPTGYIGMPELVIYGYDATATPPPPPPVNQAPVLSAIANLTLAAGTAGSTPLSATDADADAITLSFVGTRPSFVTLTDSNAGTGSVNVSTQSTAGTFTLTVRATDSKGATSDRAFTLTITAVTPPPTGMGTQTAVPKGLIAGSTWIQHLGYQAYFPEGYNPADSSVKYPIVFFFHGLGAVGDGTDSANGLQKLTRDGADRAPPYMLQRNQLQPMLSEPVIVLSPQTSQQLWLASEASTFIQYALGLYGAKINSKKVYLTGLSLGGAGPWDAINDVPGYATSPDPALRELAARLALTRSQTTAIVPICAHATMNDYRALRGIPTWAHHATGDGTVPYERTRMKMAQLALDVNPDANRPTSGTVTGFFNPSTSQWAWSAGTAAPGTPGEYQKLVFTVINGGTHDTWTQAYTNPEVWKWLLSQSKP